MLCGKLVSRWVNNGNVEKSRQWRSLPSPKRLRAGRSPFCRAHVLKVRFARQKVCGLTGRTFLTIPLNSYELFPLEGFLTIGVKKSTVS